MNSKQQRLDELKATIMKQNVCPDLKASATQLVFGDGNPDADVVFIGEAPGKNEDLQGLPFVGAAGRFLNARTDRLETQRRLHNQHRQIPATKQPRPVARRETGLFAVLIQAITNPRPKANRDTWPAQHGSVATAGSQDQPGPRPAEANQAAAAR
jgi:uracil-DNA glycosylase